MFGVKKIKKKRKLAFASFNLEDSNSELKEAKEGNKRRINRRKILFKRCFFVVFLSQRRKYVL